VKATLAVTCKGDNKRVLFLFLFFFLFFWKASEERQLCIFIFAVTSFRFAEHGPGFLLLASRQGSLPSVTVSKANAIVVVSLKNIPRKFKAALLGISL
jgi:hypothetical protein